MNHQLPYQEVQRPFGQDERQPGYPVSSAPTASPLSASTSPTSSNSSATPTAKQPRAAQAGGRAGKSLSSEEQRKNHALNERVRRREQNYFFALANKVVPNDFHAAARENLKLKRLDSKTHDVQIAKNASMTLVYIFISALKKLAVSYYQMTLHLRKQLDEADAQLTALGAENRHANAPSSQRSNVPGILRDRSWVMVQNPLSSPSIMEGLSLQSPTGPPSSMATTPGAAAAETMFDTEVEGLFEQLCLRDVIPIGLAFGRSRQDLLNEHCEIIKTKAEEDVDEKWLPEELISAGREKVAGGNRSMREAGER